MKDHITLITETLRKIQATASSKGLPETAKLAGETAKQLEEYKASAGQLIPQLPPHMR